MHCIRNPLLMSNRRVDVSKNIRGHGEAWPGWFANRLDTHCSTTTCGDGFAIEGRFDNGGLALEPANLVVETQGAYATVEIRGALIAAMKAVVGANIQVEERPCVNPRAMCAALIHRSLAGRVWVHEDNARADRASHPRHARYGDQLVAG